jgi:hypothetical protein
MDYGLWQYLEAEKMMGNGAAPNVCGGGVFGYLGPSFKVRGNLGGEFLALAEYDTNEGGTWGFLAGGALGGATVGGEWLRYDGAWHSSPIVLAGKESSTARKFIGKPGAGLLFSPHSFEAFDLGFYAGGVGGGGAYLSLSVGACQ